MFGAPRCEVKAVVDPNPAVQEWVRKNLSESIPVFTTTTELYQHFGCKQGAAPFSSELDAVVISTETSMHAALACEAIGLGLHTLLEKPISTNPEGELQVAAASKERPDVKLVVALSRRFDPSYRSAFKRVAQGNCGDAFLIKSATIDQYDESGWFVPYSLKSGGIFIGMYTLVTSWLCSHLLDRLWDSRH